MIRIVKRSGVLVFAVMGVLGVSPATHADSALYQPQAPASFTVTNQPWACSTGFRFTPNKNIFVTQLGGAFSGTKTVSIYRPDGTVAAQASVPGRGQGYWYTMISPVPLKANTTYTIGVWLNSSGGNEYIASGGLTPAANGDITVSAGCYNCLGAGDPCLNTSTVAIWGVPDFKYRLDTALYEPIAPGPAFGPFTGTYNMGYRFTPNKSISVTSLGAYVAQASTVALYNSTGTQLGSTVTVTCPRSYPCWAYTPLPAPQSLTAGLSYQVGVLGSKYYYYSDGAPNTRNPDFTINNGCWSSTTTQSQPCVNNSGGIMYGGADIEYSINVGSCSNITAPGSYLVTGNLTAAGSSNCVSINNASNVSLDCQNHSLSGGTNANALAIVNSSGVTAKNCVLDLPSGRIPLQIQSSSNSSVSGSTMGSQTPDSTTVASVNDSSSINLVSNVVAGSISVNFSTMTSVRQNNVTCRAYAFTGITLQGGSHNTASGNTIIGSALCDDGIVLGNLSGMASEDYDNIIDNHISGNWDAGIETLGLIRNTHFDNNIMTNNPYLGIGGWFGMGFDNSTFVGNTIDSSSLAFDFNPSSHFGAYTAFYFRNNVFAYNTVTNPTSSGGDIVMGPSVSSSEVNNAPIYEGNNVFTGNSWGATYCPPNFVDYNSTLATNVTDGGNNVCFTGNLATCNSPITGTEPITCHNTPGCGGWQHDAGGGLGCWYTGTAGQSCNTVCASHGGFNPTTSTHTGNRAGRHFWSSKASGGNVVSVECSSTDDNTNWGADGNTPSGSYSSPVCMLSCSCNN
jgi:hypothetical protein